MRACVIGTGYVGLVTGVCLAEIGHDVICVDSIQAKIDKLNKGIAPFFEPGLDGFYKKNARSGRLRFTSDLQKAVETSEFIFISVGTPSLPNGGADLSQVESAASDIGRFMNREKIVVNKSTVPIGTGDWVSMIISESQAKANGHRPPRFHVVSNPEFLREGTAITDTFFPDRIVIGSTSNKAIEKMLDLYRPLIEQDFDWPKKIPRLIPRGCRVPVVISDLASAEMIKYAANAFLATKISYINEVASICEKVGADALKVAEGIGLDKRIGPRFLSPGIGYGGSCFPKDVSALAYIANEYGLSPQILNAVMSVNREQRLKIVNKVQDELKTVKGKTIAVLGISFKPDTDDTREAPSISIMNSLVNMGAKVRAHDPVVRLHPDALSRKVELCPDMESTLKAADLLILATEWDQFKTLDFRQLKRQMAHPIVIDGRNHLDKTAVQKAGFRYLGVGR